MQFQLPSKVEIGGRMFGVVNYDHITVINEHYILSRMSASGLDRVLPIANETNAEYYARLQMEVIGSLKLPELLGGYLLPSGKTETDWTPEIAAETAKFFGSQQAVKDRETVRELGAAICLDFFRVGIALLNHSRSVSPPSQSAPAQQPSAGAAH